MPNPGPRSDSLWAFLWGKRRHRRHPISLGAEIRGLTVPIAVTTMDLSTGGVLLCVPLRRLENALDSESNFLMGLHAALGTGFDIRFSEAGIGVEARLVRIAWPPRDSENLYLGCEFARPLSARALRTLGISEADCVPESGIQACRGDQMRYGVHPSRPLALAVRVGDGAATVSGDLVGVQDAALAATLGPADPTELVARLSRQQLEAAVLYREESIWSGRAHLLAVRLLDDLTDGVEVVLLASSAPDASVTRRMKRRPTAEPVA
jgi:hypothetical protein